MPPRPTPLKASAETPRAIRPSLIKTSMLIAAAMLAIAPAAEAEFKITLSFSGSFSNSQLQAYQTAADYWNEKIIGYKTGVTLTGMTIDVFAENDPGATYLAYAGPRTFDTQQGTLYATSGESAINRAYWGDGTFLEGNGSLDKIMIHEFGHILGIGTLWEANGLYVSGSGKYTGEAALAGWRDEFGNATDTFVPVEMGGGPGTREGHWDEKDGGGPPTGIISRYNGKDFRDELMTGWASDGIFTSRVSLGAIVDLGYRVAANADATDNYTITSGVYFESFVGARTLTKNTAGTATLLGDSDFNGGTTLNGGKLILRNNRALGTGNVAILATSELDVNTIGLAGIGTLTLDGGAITADTAAKTRATLEARKYDVRAGIIEAGLTGTGDLIKTTGGTVTLTASNSHTGGNVISAGTLNVTADNGLGTGGTLVNGGTLELGATTQTGLSTLTLDSGVISGGVIRATGMVDDGAGGTMQVEGYTVKSGVVSAKLTGTTGLLKTGTGTVTLSGENSFSGGVTVEGGQLVGSARDAFGSGAVSTVGGRLVIAEADAARLATLDYDTGAIDIASGLQRVSVGKLISTGVVALQVSHDIGTNNASWTHAGSFTGDGTLTKAGTGTLTLQSASTHTGGTYVSGGTLLVKSVNALGNGDFGATGGKLEIGDLNLATTGKFVLNGGSVVSTNAGSVQAAEFALSDGTVQTGLVGGGKLIKSGDGTATLTRANTYTGGTAITGGTLLVKEARALSTGAVSVEGGTLQLEAPVTGIATLTLKSGGTLAGRIGSVNASAYAVEDGTIALRLAGSAQMVKTTSGTVTLAKDMSFSGGLIVNEGVVAVTNPFALDKSVTTVNANGSLRIGENSSFASLWTGPEITLAGGALEVNLASGTTISRAITGTGGVELTGTGEITFTKATYTGDTRVKSGTLVLTNGAMMPGDVVVDGTGAVEIRSGAARLEVNQSVSGTGSVRLSGASEIRLTRSFGNTGALEIASGATAVLGESGSPTLTLGNNLLNIRQGARLGGSATIAGSLNNQGTLAPGFSPGAITLGGDFTNTGTLQMEISGATGAHDEIRYAGQAFLGGNLEIIYIDGTPAKGSIVSLLTDTDTTDGRPSIVGRFTNITISGGRGITYAAANGLNYVVGGTLFDIPGAHIPQAARLESFVNALADASVTNASVNAIASPLLNTGAQLANNIRAAAPLGYAAATTLAISQADDDTARLGAHLNARRYERAGSWLMDYSPYVYLTGANAGADDGKDGRAFDHSSVGGAVGTDYEPNQDLTVGAKIGYDSGKGKFHRGAGEITQDHLRVTVYASQLYESRYFVDSGLSAGYSLYEAKHTTALGKQTGDTRGWDMGGFVTAGMVAPLSSQLSLTPHAGFTLTRAQVGGFDESGTATALKIDDFDQVSLTSRIGAGLNRLARVGETKVRLALDATWVHEWMDTEIDIKGTVAGNSFTTSAVAGVRDRVEVGPDADFHLDENQSISVGYKYSHAFGDAVGHRFDIGYRTRF